MKTSIYFALLFTAVTAGCLAATAQGPVLFDGTSPVVLSFQSAPAALPSNDAIPRAQLISADELAKSLQSAHNRKPLLFAVGPRSLYAQAHIPGSEYIGAASTDGGRQQLRDRVKSLPHSTPIVIYCGCCPWSHCPNMHPAYQELHALGFTNVKVLYIADNFGADWVDKGYPVAKGE